MVPDGMPLPRPDGVEAPELEVVDSQQQIKQEMEAEVEVETEGGVRIKQEPDDLEEKGGIQMDLDARASDLRTYQKIRNEAPLRRWFPAVEFR
jgi:hypothetical protein